MKYRTTMKNAWMLCRAVPCRALADIIMMKGSDWIN